MEAREGAPFRLPCTILCDRVYPAMRLRSSKMKRLVIGEPEFQLSFWLDRRRATCNPAAIQPRRQTRCVPQCVG